MKWFSNDSARQAETRSLCRVLCRCRELVACSADSDWSCVDVAGILNSLDSCLVQLSDGSSLNVNELKLLFLPTGPLQETSIDNGWGDEFLELASEFDELIAKRC